MEFKDFASIKSKLAKSLKDTLTREATPPDGKPLQYEVHIPYHLLVASEADEPLTAKASVTYIVHSPTEKKNTTHIKFKYTEAGKFLNDSVTYV